MTSASSAIGLLFVVVTTAAAEERAPHGDAGHERDPHGHCGRDRADEDVAVADVTDLVGQHAAQLLPVAGLEDALGDRDRGVVGVAAGGEGVGLHVGRDVELGHRHAGLGGQLADDAVVLGHLLLGDGLGPRRP